MKNLNSFFLFAAFAACAFLMPACSGDEGSDSREGNENTGQENVPVDLSAFREHTNNFALNLFQAMNIAQSENENSFVVAPFSAAAVLGMLYEGAEGATREELYQALHADNSVAISEAFAKIIAEAPKADPDVKLALANALFVNSGKGHSLQADYQQRVGQCYNAAVVGLDFARQDALETINDWARNQTNGLIDNLLEPNELDPEASLCVTNATYMLAPWQLPFDKKESQGGTFRKHPDYATVLPFMVQRNAFAVCQTGQYQAVSLPYANGNFEMIVVLPKVTARQDATDAVNTLVAQTDEAWLEDLYNGLAMRENVELHLPHFITSTSIQLNDVLTALGLTTTFTPQALFTQICQNEQLWVEAFKQKAKIIVTEEGTEAAAVSTALMFGAGLEENPPYHFIANHPFIYIVREKQSGCIFFMGKYMGD